MRKEIIAIGVVVFLAMVGSVYAQEEGSDIKAKEEKYDELYDKGMFNEAIAEYEKAIAINSNDAEAHNNLAVTYYYKGQYDLAIKHCDKAIELGGRVHPGFLEALRPYRK
ncbi:MAG: hypothetical protein COX40_02670 [Candidatus Omnitrophica bacterium CG23_combo_of_CG06-09_8_20_14_all_40_11]|nr:MAG: hypothetical protein COX40_02670 [Candidatus Omnitrophica bacterium CG23_combo_of_CG06-09_8_20_14_all_40_11]